MSVIIDSDFGVDDTFCIHHMMELHNLQITNIIGITTVCGNIKAKNAYTSGKYIVKQIFESDIPVFYSPHSRANDERCNYFYGEDGHYGLIQQNCDYAAHVDSSNLETSVEFLLKSLNTIPDLTIIAIGPLTNLAFCEIVQPGVLAKAKQILIMGGAVKTPGNITKDAEYNFYIDPASVLSVIKNSNVVLFPLDITLTVKWQVAQLKDQLRTHPKWDFYKYVIDGMYKQEVDTGEIADDSDYVIIHDPITALYYKDSSAFRVENEQVNVSADGNIFICGDSNVFVKIAYGYLGKD